MALHRLITNVIPVGEPLPWDLFAEAGRLLLRKGGVISSLDQADALFQRGIYIEAEEAEAAPEPTPSDVLEPEDEPTSPFGWWTQSEKTLSRLLHGIHATPDFVGQIARLARSVDQVVEHFPDGAIAGGVLPAHPSYPVAHCLRASVLCSVIGRFLGWPPERIHSTLCAALTMNLGMLELQSVLQEQMTPPTDEQRRQIQEHPFASQALLKRVGVTDELWLRAVVEHHECPSGTGYPHRIKEITDEALLIRAVDVFGAIVSPRASRPAFNAQAAARLIFLEEGQNAANPLSGALIKVVGIYPPGSFVKLASGESGVVLRRGESANAPVVSALLSSTDAPYHEPVERDTGRPAYKISGVLSRADVPTKFDLAKLWEV